MNRPFLRGFFLGTMFIILFVLAIAATDGQSAPGPKTAEQAFKNIDDVLRKEDEGKTP